MIIVVNDFWLYISEVFWALMPLFITFLIFHYISFRLPPKQFWNIVKGIILTFIGLTLFLYGIKLAFIDIGYIIGEYLGTTRALLLIPIGFLLGFVVTLAEPAVQVLTNQIDKISSGYINKKIFLYFLSFGVAISVSLSMIRILTGLSLWYFILPGYILVLILIRYVSPLFIGLAFDSGGVVTGPMIVAFILSINLGISKVVETNNVLLDCFGLVALVSLIPILSVLIMGLIYERSMVKEGVKNDAF